MLIERIVDARLADRPGAHTLDLADGRVAQITSERVRKAERTPASLRARGRLLLPALVDAHVHLDKAFLLHATSGAAPTLAAAIESVAAARGLVPFGDVLANAERAIETLLRHGVTAARVHVEIEPNVGLDLVHMQRALADSFADRLTLQLVAFPQLGLEPAGMLDLMASALVEGLQVVGGCPYVDADPGRHLDQVFALAERFAAPIDLHLDFSDDPSRSLLGLVAERVRAHGLQGQVTIGHVTTLAAMPSDEQARALDLLAESGIALILLPVTDLYLAGHGQPGSRSLAPLARARAAGVRVALANNNLQNPFSPFGNGSLLQAAWLTGIVERAADARTRQWLFEAITSEPAAILGLPAHGPSLGALAHLVLVDAPSIDELMLSAAPVLATVHSSRVVHALHGPTAD